MLLPWREYRFRFRQFYTTVWDCLPLRLILNKELYGDIETQVERLGVPLDRSELQEQELYEKLQQTLCDDIWDNKEIPDIEWFYSTLLPIDPLINLPVKEFLCKQARLAWIKGEIKQKEHEDIEMKAPVDRQSSSFAYIAGMLRSHVNITPIALKHICPDLQVPILREDLAVIEDRVQRVVTGEIPFDSEFAKKMHEDASELEQANLALTHLHFAKFTFPEGLSELYVKYREFDDKLRLKEFQYKEKNFKSEVLKSNSTKRARTTSCKK